MGRSITTKSFMVLALEMNELRFFFNLTSKKRYSTWFILKISVKGIFRKSLGIKNTFCQIVGIYRCFRGSFGDKIFDTWNFLKNILLSMLPLSLLILSSIMLLISLTSLMSLHNPKPLYNEVFYINTALIVIVVIIVVINNVIDVHDIIDVLA